MTDIPSSNSKDGRIENQIHGAQLTLYLKESDTSYCCYYTFNHLFPMMKKDTSIVQHCTRTPLQAFVCGDGQHGQLGLGDER